MIFKNLLLIFLIVFPVTLLSSTKGFAYAELDVPDDEEDSETDVEDLQTDADSAVVTSEDLQEEDEPGEQVLKASPDADTTFLFTQPAGTTLELPAGKDVHFLVGFANRGQKDFIVEALDASFRYPLDFTFHIQNFSAIPYNRVVKPKQDITLYYGFYTSDTYSSRPFGLVVNLYYKDSDGHQYLDAVFNETVTIVEMEDSLDGETFFLYILLAACAVLIFVAAQQFLVSFTKKKLGSSSGHKIETGTQNHHNDVDYDWIPKETLNELSKSPRRSDRLSPRKSKQSQSRTTVQAPPKQFPKEQVTRRAKRGTGVKEDR